MPGQRRHGGLPLAVYVVALLAHSPHRGRMVQRPRGQTQRRRRRAIRGDRQRGRRAIGRGCGDAHPARDRTPRIGRPGRIRSPARAMPTSSHALLDDAACPRSMRRSTSSTDAAPSNEASNEHRSKRFARPRCCSMPNATESTPAVGRHLVWSRPSKSSPTRLADALAGPATCCPRRLRIVERGRRRHAISLLTGALVETARDELHSEGVTARSGARRDECDRGDGRAGSPRGRAVGRPDRRPVADPAAERRARRPPYVDGRVPDR